MTDFIRRVRKEVHVDCIALPQGQHNTMPMVFPKPPFPPAEKENPGWTTSSSTQHGGWVCANPYSNIAPQGLHGILWGSTTGNLTVMKKERVLQQPAHGSWVPIHVHTYSAQVVIPIRSLALLQNKVGNLLSLRAGRYFIAPSTSEYSTQSQPSSKPDQRTQATTEPIL